MKVKDRSRKLHGQEEEAGTNLTIPTGIYDSDSLLIRSILTRLIINTGELTSKMESLLMQVCMYNPLKLFTFSIHFNGF